MAIAPTQKRRISGLFDIRNIIGALLLVYGVVLLLVALFGDARSTTEQHVGSANLWTGLALLVAGGAFVVWARLRPIVVPEEVVEDLGADHDRGATESG